MLLSRRSFLAAPVAAVAQTPAPKPNVLFLFSDDQTFRTLGALNNPAIKTPNLDKLAARGTAFTHAFIMGGTQGAVCVPSRAMLMSGQTLWHATANVIENKGGDFDLFPEHLARNGYHSIGIGKWHNGPKLFHRAFQQGGPVMFGGMADHINTPVHAYNAAGSYPKDAVKNYPRHSSELFADATIGFLKNRDKQKPFCLYCAFTAPHDPRQPPPAYKAMYPEANIELPPNFLPEHPFNNGELKIRDEALLPWPRTKPALQKEISDYYALITHLDAQIGRILATLEAEGLASNTVVIFAGDNGLALGQHGLLGKQSLYDHSIRVPLLLAGPGIPANQKVAAGVYLFDLFPAICDLTATPKPGTLDGKSLVPLLNSPNRRLRDAMVFGYRTFQRALRTTRWKYIRYNVAGKQTTQLFDIQADPWEMHDLSALPDNKETVNQLETLLRMELKSAGDPLNLTKPDWGVPAA